MAKEEPIDFSDRDAAGHEDIALDWMGGVMIGRRRWG
jgi:hypothetical protein